MARILLTVTARFEDGGRIIPLIVSVEDKEFMVTDVKIRSDNVKAPWGSQPIKYECVIKQKIKFIYFDKNCNQWYSIIN